MIFTPATVVPTHLLRLLNRPDILAAFRHAEEHPEELVRLTIPDGPDVDWENPDEGRLITPHASARVQWMPNLSSTLGGDRAWAVPTLLFASEGGRAR